MTRKERRKLNLTGDNTKINPIIRNSEKGMVRRHRQGKRFNGVTEGFSDPQDRNFNKARLRAYLKGKKEFYFGYEGIFPNRYRKVFSV